MFQTSINFHQIESGSVDLTPFSIDISYVDEGMPLQDRFKLLYYPKLDNYQLNEVNALHHTRLVDILTQRQKYACLDTVSADKYTLSILRREAGSQSLASAKRSLGEPMQQLRSVLEGPERQGNPTVGKTTERGFVTYKTEIVDPDENSATKIEIIVSSGNEISRRKGESESGALSVIAAVERWINTNGVGEGNRPTSKEK